ncbi:uncharacterized protein I303_101756 [Kwoniella dejecticola CBS 10117]|uniref:SH3 domain-containing protein n=1 Tax=Kwoniella dejecticola CBS 10117 TaxID=1296121 RepID=A0A1A6ACW4_9TREE|nr:uncharacterized protein I303_02108 [Kwoniella dejecticola CBS 10117]OBR87894.1 hypothetical protein I303_02108 [Kwoniella dejecticola CBS 10117]
MAESQNAPQTIAEEDVTAATQMPADSTTVSSSSQNLLSSPSKTLPSSTSPTKSPRLVPSVSPSPSIQSPAPLHGVIDLASPASSPSKRVSSTPSLTSSRPAPASPASSRPPSTQFDAAFVRDRSASTSSRGGRRISSSSAASNANPRKPRSASRASSKPRPKSMLGTNIILPESDTPSSSGKEPESCQSQISIPENISEPSASQSQSQIIPSSDAVTDSFQVVLPGVVIRDFAFEAEDERYHGRGVVEEADTSGSGGFKWPFKSDYGESSASGGGGGGGGWGGFGFLGGWRNRPTKSMGNDDGRPTFEDEDSDEGEFETAQEEGEEYYSSPAQSESGETFGYSYNILEPLPEDVEPKGYYRAAYPFEALSSSEMTLQEGDLVSLNGRGNGDPGWVIARRVRVLAGKIAGIDEVVGLVPESYLERVEVIED